MKFPSPISRSTLITCLLLGLLWLTQSGFGKDIQFGGYTWSVRTGQGGPGPNRWDDNNVWLDASNRLHLKITHRDGKWSCAEVTMLKRLGFGRYEFRLTGRIDQLDDNVVVGLFNYPTGEVGPDGTNEIDIEFARWGSAKNPMGNFTVWPVLKELKQVTKSFPFSLSGDQSIHTFFWSPEQLQFRSVQGLPGKAEVLCEWTFRPSKPLDTISQQPMPVHINLWLFKGLVPKNGEEVEVVVDEFRFFRE